MLKQQHARTHKCRKYISSEKWNGYVLFRFIWLFLVVPTILRTIHSFTIRWCVLCVFLCNHHSSLSNDILWMFSSLFFRYYVIYNSLSRTLFSKRCESILQITRPTNLISSFYQYAIKLLNRFENWSVAILVSRSMHGRWAFLNYTSVSISIHFLMRSQFIHLLTSGIRRDFFKDMKEKKTFNQ